MYNLRRLKPVQDQADTYADDPNAYDQDPMGELARLIDGDRNPRHGQMSHDDLADALAAEFERDSALEGQFRPVEFPQAKMAKSKGYDLWDDSALADLPDDFSNLDFQNFDELMQGLPGDAAPDPLPEAQPSGGLSRMKLAMLAAVAIVVLAGGGAAAWVFMSGSLPGLSAPQLIAAPTQPFKIIPAAGDTIDEPVDTASTETPTPAFDPTNAIPPKSEERLVVRDETIGDLPGVNPQVNRVVLPNGDEIAAEPMAPVETGPRRVRTVLVKPDGTIIETPDRTAPEPQNVADNALAPVLDAAGVTAPAEDDPMAGLLPPVEPEVPVAETPAVDVATAAPDAPVEPETPAASEEPIGLPPIEEPLVADTPAVEAPVAETPAAVEPAQPEPGVRSVTTEPLVAPDTTDAAPATDVAALETPIDPAVTDPDSAPIGDPVVATKPPRGKPSPEDLAAAAAKAKAAEEAKAAAKAKAATPSDGPLDLAAAASQGAAQPVQVASAQPVASGAVGGGYVQVSSQKSEAAARAAFESLQRKFPGVLSGASLSIQQADLGAKGIYYRARVVTGSGAEAVSLCQALKSAGADCVVARK